MAKIPEPKDTLTFSRQVQAATMDGKQVVSLGGYEERGMQIREPKPGAGNQVPVSSLPKNFQSPKSPTFPKKK
ncbi:hypothetical protein BVY05_07630 [Pectobacterium odoriferum]|nr:hypothetical protein BVY05_07630 [Pectobacterium odoriferum]